MLAFITIMLLLVTALGIGVLHLLRPGFAYFWLVAMVSALLAWPLALLSRVRLPETFIPLLWRPADLFPSSPFLLVDNLSWPFALALATLLFSMILTDVARAAEADWLTWGGSLALTGLGLLAVQSGNALTLMLAWAALDSLELAILLTYVRHGEGRERIVIAFFPRVASILLVLWASLAARSQGSEILFSAVPGGIPAQASLYLLLAAGLRLGVVPLHLFLMKEEALRRGLGTTTRLVPAAASLALLARTANTGVPSAFFPYLATFAGLAAVLGGLAWVTARDELEGRPYWLIGMGALAVASALRGQPAACLAWGIATLFSGGLLFYMSARSRWLVGVGALGFVGVTALPYTPAWKGAYVFVDPVTPLTVLLLLSQALLLAGYLGHILRRGPSLYEAERWVGVIYPLGLIILPISHFIAGWWGGVGNGPFQLAIAWPGAVALALVAGLAALSRRIYEIPERVVAAIRGLLSFGWLYHYLWILYQGVGRLLNFMTTILEGDGGILWSLLLLALLIAYFVGRGLGG
jgi:hypothetical protein